MIPKSEIQNLPDKLLLEAHERAKELHLDPGFIKILEDEIKCRNL